MNRLILGTWILLAAVSMAAAGNPGPRGLGNSATGADEGDRAVDGATTLVASKSSTSTPGIQSRTLAKADLSGYTIRRTVPEVRLQFSVTDEHGRLVTGLSLDDFRIFDNQSAVQQIRQFSRLGDLPLELGILLDVSDSVRTNVANEKLATQFLLQQVLRPQTDRAFLMGFGHQVKLIQPSTGDPTALRQGLDRIQQLGYTTNLYDGLFSACLGQFPRTGDLDVAQRVIVLLSDGEDTDSLHGLSDVIALAQRNEIQIFAVSVHAKRKSAPGDEVLRRLADETGGRFYLATSNKEYSAIFADMEQQMRTQYAVSFQPQQETLGFHALRLDLTGLNNMRVRARQGYYFEAP